MRRFVCRSFAVAACLVLFGAAAPLAAQDPDPANLPDQAVAAKAKPKSSPAMVLITVNEEGVCTVYPKDVAVVGKDAAPGTKGPKSIRWIYGRGHGDLSEVSVTAHPTEPKKNLFKLPKIKSSDNEGNSSDAQETVPGDEYYFRYLVTIELDGDYLDCDPQICIKNNNGGCTI